MKHSYRHDGTLRTRKMLRNMIDINIEILLRLIFKRFVNILLFNRLLSFEKMSKYYCNLPE